MSKKMLFILMIGMIVLLIGCESFYEIYTPNEEKIIDIELIYYHNPNARENPSQLYDFDLNKLETKDRLDQTKIETFVDGLVDITGLGIPDSGVLFSHDGIGIRIIYENNYTDIITLTTINENAESRFFYSSFDDAGKLINAKDIFGTTRIVNMFNSLLEEFFNIG